ncbi:MAG: pyridoxamine 5'-phosphate oxidase family protein [Calditrichia bacterium]
MAIIRTIEELESMYNRPGTRAVQKSLTSMDKHCKRFIELSPFVLLSSSSQNGDMDCSPRGGEPGFIKVFDDRTLLIPDRPGNNRLDSLHNLIETKKIGLLFLIPGVDETLRINGIAELSTDPELLNLCVEQEKQPKLVVSVSVEEAFLHCAKALMRSGLWSDESRVNRNIMPTMGKMLKEQLQSATPEETQEEMLERYKKSLY